MLEIVRMPLTPDFAPGSSGLLPARMAPLPDELLSSWLVRLAMAHGMKLHSFCGEVFGKHASIWNRDIDKSADETVLRTLAKNTNVSFERVFQTTLAAYAGKIYENHIPNGNTTWIMPLKIYHRQRLRQGLQICPFCLLEDVEPYYRRQWRLSFITVCEKHAVILLDRCPDCSSPIIFHRQEMGRKNQPMAFSMTECAACEMLWTSHKSLSSCQKADHSSIIFQTHLKRTIRDGWTIIKNYGCVYALSYFAGLKQILRILSVCNKTARFRKEMRSRTGIPLSETVEQFNFDRLPIQQRVYVLQSAQWLLSDWANRFIEVAKSSKIWSSGFMPYDSEPPFWFWSVVRENLSVGFYGSPPAEIHSALSVLEKKHEALNLFIRPFDLKVLMRNKEILPTKNVKLRAEIYERIKKFNQRLFETQFTNKSNDEPI